MTTYHTIL